jgi:hypothetical protein
LEKIRIKKELEEQRRREESEVGTPRVDPISQALRMEFNNVFE